jgi:hypothetical protein
MQPSDELNRQRVFGLRNLKQNSNNIWKPPPCQEWFDSFELGRGCATHRESRPPPNRPPEYCTRCARRGTFSIRLNDACSNFLPYLLCRVFRPVICTVALINSPVSFE